MESQLNLHKQLSFVLDESHSVNIARIVPPNLLRDGSIYLNAVQLAAVYHPEVLNLPFLPHCRKQVKLFMVGALEFSSDPT